MNYRMILNVMGRIIMAEAALLLLPVAVAVYYNEASSLNAFLITAGIALGIGLLFCLVSHTKDRNIYAREGFVSVAFAWIFLSLIGAVPFYLTGYIPNFIDAVFEAVSGFTTTGASIVPSVENLSNSVLFWRSFTHWIGGMGVLVFVMAIVPGNAKGNMNVLRAEMPGPVIGKLVPRIKDTAKILYLIYIALTLLEVVFLLFGGMSFFESIVHSIGTAGTGGFGIKNNSVGGYSPYIQWVITAFMLIFGINFNLFYLILIKRVRTALKSTELWIYFGIIFFAVAAITTNIFSIYGNLSDSVRHSSFQVASIISTTGFATTDFNTWPILSKGIIFALMFMGGCAGSTAGGFKVSRAAMLFRTIGREIKKILHPRSVTKVRFEGKSLEDTTVDSVTVYLAIYILCFIVIFLLLCLDPVEFTGYSAFETHFTTATTCFNNVGPAFGACGPASNFAAYSGFSKIIMSFAMLLGRLEIFPLIIALSPSTWSRKYK